MLSRKLALLFAAAGMAVMVLALAGMAWAAPGPPTVVSTVPMDGATGVDVNADIKAKFSEAMKARSIDSGTFYLLPGHFTYEEINSGCPQCLPAGPTATARYNAGSRTAVPDPTEPLSPDIEYTAVVEGMMSAS